MSKIIGLSCLMAIILSACGKGKSGVGAESELIRLNNLYDSAIVHEDITTLKRLYAKDYVYTNPEGKLLTKDEQTTSISSSEIKWHEGKSTEVRVKVYGKMAIVTGLFVARGDYRGNPLNINERYTSVWMKGDTSWQLIAEQGNVIK